MEKIVLPKEVDKEIMEMLIKANYFIENAKKNSFSSNDFDRAIAVHNLDNAIEYILRIIIKHLDIENIKGITINTPELMELFGQINKFLKEYGDDSNSIKQLPYRVEIDVIRKMRNLIQHGLTWNSNELSKYINDGEKFFEKILERIFGIRRSDIAYSSLIKNEIVKKELIEAENKIKEGEYLKSIVASRNAFEYANFIYNNQADIRIQRAPALSELRKNTQFIYDYLKILDENCNIGLFGIDLVKYKRFKEYLSYIPFDYLANKRMGYSVLQRELEIEDAEFCYNFVSDVILKLELNQYKPIDSLNDVEDQFQVEFVERISGIKIDKIYAGYGCKYLFGKNEARLFYTDTIDKEKLENILTDKNNILYEFERYTNHRLDIKSEHLIEVISYDVNLVVNNPDIWEIIIIFNEIPFTTKNNKNTGINIDNIINIENLDLDNKKEALNYLENNSPIDTLQKATKLNELLGDYFKKYDLYSENLISALHEIV